MACIKITGNNKALSKYETNLGRITGGEKFRQHIRSLHETSRGQHFSL